MKRSRDEMSEGDQAQKVRILEHDSEREFVKITRAHDLFNYIARGNLEAMRSMNLTQEEAYSGGCLWPNATYLGKWLWTLAYSRPTALYVSRGVK